MYVNITDAKRLDIWSFFVNLSLFLFFTLEVTYVRGCTCHVARNFCGSLFLRIIDFLCLAELIFAIRTDRFFLLGINFCSFQKVPSIENIFVVIEYVQ